MKFMVQYVIVYPWASPLGRLGGLGLTIRCHRGAGGGDASASLAASANYQSLCRRFARLLCLRAGAGVRKLLRNSAIIG